MTIQLVVKTPTVQVGGVFEAVVLLDPRDEKVEKAVSLRMQLERRVGPSGRPSREPFGTEIVKSPLRMEYRYRFELPFDGGVSRTGRVFDVNWVFFAVLDVPWAKDAEATAPVLVQPRRRVVTE